MVVPFPEASIIEELRHKERSNLREQEQVRQRLGSPALEGLELTTMMGFLQTLLEQLDPLMEI